MKNIAVAARTLCDTVVTKYSHFRYKCKVNYEGWNFNRGNYLFTTDTK